jgi:hypothetical protein
MLDLSVREALARLARYRPYLVLVAGVALIAVVLPGVQRDGVAPTVETTAGAGTSAGTSSATADTSAGADTAAPTADGSAPAAGVASAVGTGAPTAVKTGQAGRLAAPAGAARSADTGTAAPALAGGGDASTAADCDPVTGRIKVPSFYAPNCIPIFNGQNPGNTWTGVSKDTITVALFIPMADAAATAIAASAGATDDTSDEEDDANRELVIAAFEHHYETYGRHVKIVKVDASGEDDDDAAAKADAIKIATEIKAFASFGGYGGTNAFADELAARGVLCFCTVSQPTENYLKWAPHVWSTLMASTQGYLHRAEYVCRLTGKPAKYAGDATMKVKNRAIGLVYYETKDNAYKAGADYFEREYTSQCNGKLADRQAYILDLTKAQEDARIMVARLKDRGVTSVLFSGDPFMPIFLTQEATKANYRPEWIVSGSALTDTTFFARTYDKTQWTQAFGISYLIARLEPTVAEAEGNIVTWHCGCVLKSYPSILSFGTLYTGIHLAGPVLNPNTYRDGMFSLKRTSGFITQYAVSYGRGLWPDDDYLALDDAAELWYDGQEQGKDELGNDGVGMYRYMNMGKRYLPGQWPKDEPVPFVKDGTVVVYNERPPGDRNVPPPHEHYRKAPAAVAGK